MKYVLFVSMAFAVFCADSEAGTSSRHPLCKKDFSEVRLPIEHRSFHGPEGFVERGIRPGLLYVQREVCRCLPRRRRHQPASVRANLGIQPNLGEVKVSYRVELPWSRPMRRMVVCLGEPTFTVEPMKYVSDIITEEGRLDEVLDYPLLFTFSE